MGMCGFFRTRSMAIFKITGVILPSCVVLLGLGQELSAQQPPPAAQPAPNSAFQRMRESGRIRLGFRTEARPFSYRDRTDNAAGYSVEFCQELIQLMGNQRGVEKIDVEWVPVSPGDRFRTVQRGQADLLCAADSETPERRQEVAFSIAIFPGGIGALLRKDAAPELREVLSAKPSAQVSNAAQTLEGLTFTVVKGTTAEAWLTGKLKEFQVEAKVDPVTGYDSGVQQVQNRRAHAFFGDRAILLDAARRNPSGRELSVLDRYFTHEPVVLTMARGEDSLRLAVNQALRALYATPKSREIYVKWFGEPDDSTLAFFQRHSSAR